MLNSENMLSNMGFKMNIWVFFFIFLFYCIGSFKLTILTTGGWVGLMIMTISLYFYTACTLAFLITAINKTISKNTYIRIPNWTILCLFIVQICIYLIMPSDGGDTGGSYIYLTKLIGFDAVNNSPYLLRLINIFTYFTQILLLLYAVLIGKILFNIAQSKSSSSESVGTPLTRDIYRKQVIISLTILLIAGSGTFLTSKYINSCERSYDKDSCYYSEAVAMESGNFRTETCDKIIDPKTKGMCYGEVGTYHKNLKICDILTDTTSRDNCFLGLAIDTKDPKFCPRISNIESQNMCYRHVATTPKECNIITNKNTKDGCLYNLGSNNSEVATCALISDYNMKNNCYSNIAKTQKDYKVCYNIESPNVNIKNQCIFEVAIRLDDLTICNFINQQDYKTHCLNYLQK